MFLVFIFSFPYFKISWVLLSKSCFMMPSLISSSSLVRFIFTYFFAEPNTFLLWCFLNLNFIQWDFLFQLLNALAPCLNIRSLKCVLESYLFAHSKWEVSGFSLPRRCEVHSLHTFHTLLYHSHAQPLSFQLIHCQLSKI